MSNQSIIKIHDSREHTSFTNHIQGKMYCLIRVLKYMIQVNILVSQITCNKATWHVTPFYNCPSWNIVKGIICLAILSTEINVVIVKSPS